MNTPTTKIFKLLFVSTPIGTMFGLLMGFLGFFNVMSCRACPNDLPISMILNCCYAGLCSTYLTVLFWRAYPPSKNYFLSVWWMTVNGFIFGIFFAIFTAVIPEILNPKSVSDLSLFGLLIFGPFFGATIATVSGLVFGPIQLYVWRLTIKTQAT